MSSETFATRLLAWQERHGRDQLPWQHPRTPYTVWVSEIMLQQTRVEAVTGYFRRFMAAFSSVDALAVAPLDAVLALWAGLGYYARARNLHAAARTITARGGFPNTREEWEQLPGVGRSTAAAICAQAFGQREAILDGNARRLLARHAGVTGWPGQPQVQRLLWIEAEARLPSAEQVREGCMPQYTQAVMDIGALVCLARAPRCGECPVAQDCVAHRQGSTATIPAPRPRRELPLRVRQAAALFDDNGALWLERRPESGLWGGLYSLPEAESIGALERTLSDVWRQSLRRISGRDAVIHHVFSHYRLRLEISAFRLVDDGRFAAKVAEPPPPWGMPGCVGCWALACDVERLGLPRPIARWLQDDVLPDIGDGSSRPQR